MKADVDAGPMLAAAGLTQQQIQNQNARIKVLQQVKFLNAVAEGLQDNVLGIHLAQRFELRDLGLLYYIQASSDTLGDALRRLARYSAIYNEGVRVEFSEQNSVSVKFRYVGVARESDRHQIEFFIAILIFLCRHLAGRNLSPTSIKCMHRRFGVRSGDIAVLGCNMTFGAGIDEVCFPKSTGRLPVRNSDPYLNRLLLKYCDQALSNRKKPSSTWQMRVENALGPLLPHGRISTAVVSRGLGTSERTLARRLAAEGTTFTKVLDDLRLCLALRYLREPDLPIAKIAWLLGYRDSSAFHHAFRRWTGKSPKRVRTSGSLDLDWSGA